jgi:Mrp family chromosome partitioning ATPase
MLGLIEISEPTPAARRQTALGYYKEHLRASRVGMTFVVELKFSSLDPNLAADVLGRLVSEYLEVQAYQNARAAETATSWLRERVRGTGPTAQIIAEPLAPLVPSGLGTIPMLVGFAMLGLFAGLGVAIVRTMTDRRVRDAHELGRLTDTPYFGALPRLNSRVGPARLLRAALDNPMGPFSQTLQVVTADILGRGSRAPASVLAVASACGSEGKTVVAANLAALIASASGHRVLLVDGARANPTLTDTLASGLVQLPQDLKDKPALESVETDVLPGVDLLPVGCFAAQGASTLEIWSPGTETLIAELRQYYRHVLFDLSADSDSIDLRQAGAMLEALVLVVGTHTSDRDALEDLLGRPELRTKIRGTVLNQGHPPLRFPGLSQFASMGAMTGAVRRFQTGRKPKAKPQPAPAAAAAKRS